MGVGRVAALSRYPVKSLQGERITAAQLDARGLVGDRAWGVYTADGGIGSGKTTRRFRRIDGLLRFRATSRDEGSPLIVGPDGREHRAGNAATDRAMSEALGRAVALRPETDVAHHDESPLHIVTASSVRRLERRTGRRIDPERFRANLLIEAEDLDDAAAGPGEAVRLAVGGQVVLRLGPPMPRCRMVDLTVDGNGARPPILRALVAEQGPVFGLQAWVERPGSVRIGDAVRRVG